MLKNITLIIAIFSLVSCSLYQHKILEPIDNSSGHAVVTDILNRKYIKSYSKYKKFDKYRESEVKNKKYNLFEVNMPDLNLKIHLSDTELVCLPSINDLETYFPKLSNSIKIFERKKINVLIYYLDNVNFDIDVPFENDTAKFYFPNNFCHSEDFRGVFLRNIRRVYHEITHLYQDDMDEILSSEIQAEKVGLCYFLTTKILKKYTFIDGLDKNLGELSKELNISKNLNSVQDYSDYGALIAERELFFHLGSEKTIIKDKKKVEIEEFCTSLDV